MRFQPSAVGSAPCELTLGTGLPSVTLTANASLQSTGAVCTVSTSALDFGTVGVGASKPGSFKVRSTGTAPVSLDVVASCGTFTVLTGGGPRSLAPGDSLTISLSFAPTVGGHVACTIATGPGCPDVAVTGDATSVSFATQVRPIFTSGSLQQLPRSVERQRSRERAGRGHAPAVYVKPFNTGASALYGKVSGNYVRHPDADRCLRSSRRPS